MKVKYELGLKNQEKYVRHVGNQTIDFQTPTG